MGKIIPKTSPNRKEICRAKILQETCSEDLPETASQNQKNRPHCRCRCSCRRCSCRRRCVLFLIPALGIVFQSFVRCFGEIRAWIHRIRTHPTELGNERKPGNWTRTQYDHSVDFKVSKVQHLRNRHACVVRLDPFPKDKILFLARLPCCPDREASSNPVRSPPG